MNKSETCLPARQVKISILGFIILMFGLISPAHAKEYDGLFFMGFNLHKDVFNDKNVRYAINYAIDRKYIVQSIMSEEVVPAGMIPPGMTGYDKALKGLEYEPKKAKRLLKNASGTNLILLHTDGVKTIKIAEKIKKDLNAAGIKVTTRQVEYSDQAKWENELKSGRHHLFLMGYKAGFNDVTMEAKIDSFDLLFPLFSSNGQANFTYYESRQVDNLFDQILVIDKAITDLRGEKLSKINKIVFNDAPSVNLFYIPKL